MDFSKGYFYAAWYTPYVQLKEWLSQGPGKRKMDSPRICVHPDVPWPMGHDSPTFCEITPQIFLIPDT
ncbi:hypothetical protein BTVI_02704 [Pitangus sulphuratus]|nr:hypothetical protein BTVI_02704 [Pitangus sulphuratus]